MPTTKWMSHWKIWMSVLLATGFAVAAYAFFSQRNAVPTVQFTQPTRTTLIDEITTNGKIEPTDPQIVRSQMDSFVTGTFVKEGQTVRRGETILTLDAEQIRADLTMLKNQQIEVRDNLSKYRAGGPPDEKAQLAGDLRQAQAEVDRLQKRQDALEKLLATNASTQDEVNQNATYLERARVALDVASKKQKDFDERVAVAEQQYSLRDQEVAERIRLQEEKLQSATVTAAMDGTLYSFNLRGHDFVHVGDVMAEIADLHKLRLRAFVDESDLGHLKQGQAAEITWDAMPERTWSGKTEQIPKQVQARGERSVGEVLCSVDNDKLELLPNINVDVRILVQQKSNALVVPRNAVRTDQGKHFVFVLEGERLRRREVLLGMSNPTSYEIVSGLEESDQVAVSSRADLQDGTVVRPPK